MNIQIQSPAAVRPMTLLLHRPSDHLSLQWILLQSVRGNRTLSMYGEKWHRCKEGNSLQRKHDDLLESTVHPDTTDIRARILLPMYSDLQREASWSIYNSFYWYQDTRSLTT